MTTAIRNQHGDVLTAISGPCDVHALPEGQLPVLAEQIRRQLIETVTATGGHLGAGLGVVELTIALHRVFTSPHDIVVFDTGHQSYPHKLLTGRVKDFATLRHADGLSGYPTGVNRHTTGLRTPMRRSASRGWTASSKHWPCKGSTIEPSSR